MRIIGGAARGRQLNTPDGMDIRPTSDKVRSAIFNALFSRGGVVDAVVIDAFCGTGALGLEALSQDANSCYFFDNAKVSLNLAKQNAADLGLTDGAHFAQKDATKLGERPASTPPATVIFLDPPYRKGLIQPTLDALSAGGWMAGNAIIVTESEKDAAPITGYGEASFDKIYSETRVCFYILGE